MTRDFNQVLSEKINIDPMIFADTFDIPEYKAWIIEQCNNGHISRSEYNTILQWASETQCNLNNYNFNHALHIANKFLKEKKMPMPDDDKYKSKNVEIEFPDGKFWLKINNENDILITSNLINHDLRQYKDFDIWVLIDSQDRSIACLIKKENKYKVINNSGSSDETKRLCIKLGLDIIPDVLTDHELFNAIKSGQLKLNNIADLRSTLSRLSADQIIECNLINYAAYLPFSTIYSLYKKTNHFCLLKYTVASLIYHGLNNTKIYELCKNEIKEKYPDFIEELNSTNDDREILNIMQEAQKEIMMI